VKEQEDLFSCSFLFHICPTKIIIMKQKLLLSCLAAIIFTSSAFAQFQKGDKVLGFGLGISTYKSSQTTAPQTSGTTNSYGISTNLGFAVNEHRLHGFFINGNYGASKFEVANQPVNNTESKNYSLAGGYFTKAYKPLGKGFFVFGEANAEFNYGEQKQNPVASEQKRYGISVALYPGIAYQWSKRFLLEARFGDFVTAGYSRSENKNLNNDKSSFNNFNLSSSLGLGYLQNFGIGARWIISPKKKA
jgi:hypothetical protein